MTIVFAATIAQGSSETIIVPDRRTIEVETTNEAVISFDDARSLRVEANRPVSIPNGKGFQRFKIRAVTGTAKYSIFYSDVVPFTGDLTLTDEHDGKVLRCDDASDVTVTVPADLPECFSVGFTMWNAGTITVQAGSGATKRSSTSELSAQYKWGSLLVVKNADDASAEFVLGGDFA